jgi:hypothetical protein
VRRKQLLRKITHRKLKSIHKDADFDISRKPSEYDIDGYLASRPAQVVWLVRRYAAEIANGLTVDAPSDLSRLARIFPRWRVNESQAELQGVP